MFEIRCERYRSCCEKQSGKINLYTGSLARSSFSTRLNKYYSHKTGNYNYIINLSLAAVPGDTTASGSDMSNAAILPVHNKEQRDLCQKARHWH